MPYGTANSDWAMPIKFPEAIGMGLPVLAGAGTAVGRAVAEQHIGWTVGRPPAEFVEVVRKLDGGELARARRAVRDVQPMYTWTERAREIAEIAVSLRRGEADRVARPV
jgi:glycosyltransferase involved in cell wall biosynthesis